MQILLISLVAAVAAVQTPSVNQGLTRSASVMVRAVIDGDTIDVATIGRVRLLGVDAPGTAEPFAGEARERLAALVLRRWVRLEHEGSALDVGGRHRAYVVRDDGLFVNIVLVREGLARVSAGQALVRLAELERAEAEAQSFRRGMWGSAPQTPGTSYTHRSNGGRSPSTKSRNTRKTRPKSQQRPKT
ncbi:MAG: thermonuclease family protein [Vicinamibacterales bacterium]|nr:thermonuclease family protein [Vicinamibacterales bacterium]